MPETLLKKAQGGALIVARGAVAAGLRTQVCPGWGALRYGGAVLGPLISARAGLVRRAGVGMTASACAAEG